MVNNFSKKSKICGGIGYILYYKLYPAPIIFIYNIMTISELFCYLGGGGGRGVRSNHRRLRIILFTIEARLMFHVDSNQSNQIKSFLKHININYTTYI